MGVSGSANAWQGRARRLFEESHGAKPAAHQNVFAGPGPDFADANRVAAQRMAAQRRERLVDALRPDDRDDLALIGDEPRVKSEKLAGAAAGFRERPRVLVEDDVPRAVLEELVEHAGD